MKALRTVQRQNPQALSIRRGGRLELTARASSGGFLLQVCLGHVARLIKYADDCLVPARQRAVIRVRGRVMECVPTL
jgi:hypothetical protein